MMKLARLFCAFVLATAVHAGASAALLVERPPAGVLYGIQSDASTGPLLQALALGGASVERVTWWGFHGANSLGPGADQFEVYLDGRLAGGILSSSEENGLTRHVLQLSAAVANPAVLAVVNNSFDVEWFWQSVMEGDDANAAFALEGARAVAVVPEPGSAAMLALGLLGCAAARRKPRRGPAG